MHDMMTPPPPQQTIKPIWLVPTNFWATEIVLLNGFVLVSGSQKWFLLEDDMAHDLLQSAVHPLVQTINGIARPIGRCTYRPHVVIIGRIRNPEKTARVDRIETRRLPDK